MDISFSAQVVPQSTLCVQQLTPESLWTVVPLTKHNIGYVFHELENSLRKSMLNTASTINGFSLTVDKSKAKGSSRSQQQGHTNCHPDLVPPETKPRGLEYYKALCEKKNQTIQQLKNSFIASNRRFEAIAVVVQTLYIQVCSFFFHAVHSYMSVMLIDSYII